jgi:hypothetical protein
MGRAFKETAKQEAENGNEGHGFSRAENASEVDGFATEVRFSQGNLCGERSMKKPYLRG